MTITWQLREEDREFFARELEDFVPDKIYDLHAHLWRQRDWEGQVPQQIQSAPDEIALDSYRELMTWILPGRTVHGLHFAFPTWFPNDPAPPNTWVSQQVKQDPLARGQFYVRPTDDPEWVRQEVKWLGMRGLKPFAGFADRADRENAEIPEFFPEPLARVAHEENWSVTLHLQRARSLADPSNQHWIRTYCQRYPNMILILDHCARGFNPYHCLEGISQLGAPENLYVDTSVICSPLAVMACLQHLGPERVLYGSDFWCSHCRGANLPIGDSFLWLEEDMDIGERTAYRRKPVLVGLENLRAVKAAFRILRLSDQAIEDYFWGNAARLFGL